MKNSKTCPKCGSKRILVSRYENESYVCLSLGMFCACGVLCYACVDCGYIESWVDDQDHSKLKKRYEKL